jgi:hypothetical protein
MNRVGLLRAGMLAVATGAVGVATAHASVTTFQVSGSLSPQVSSANCAPSGCTLGGEIVINDATGAVISADVTATGLLPSMGPFTAPQALHTTSDGLTDLEIDTAPSFTAVVALIFSTPTAGSLIGYTGGSLSNFTDVRNQSGDLGWILTSGSLTETAGSPIPESPAWAMMLLGFAGLGLASLRKTRRAVSTAA